jgi:hypothetical protein
MDEQQPPPPVDMAKPPADAGAGAGVCVFDHSASTFDNCIFSQ